MIATPQQSEPATRMELPRPDGAIFIAIFSTIIAFFVAVAFYNLAHYRVFPVYAIVLSIIWLLIVTASVYCGITEEHGVRNFVCNRMAPFSRHHFVEALQRAGAGQVVRFCFTFFNRRFTLLEIPSSKIASIKWSAGQATSLAGRDMEDWHVVVWYHRNGSKRWTTADDYREEALHIVGPSGPKTKTARTGQALVAFLESRGVIFVPASNKCEFTTSDPGTAR